MASKKTVMGMVTAFAGAITNVVLNLILIPRMGPSGAAVATVTAFIVVFITRAIDTKKYVNINFSTPAMVTEVVILAAQAAVMIFMQSGIAMYAIELALLVVMLVFNYKPIKELVVLLADKFLKKGRKNKS